LEYTKLALIDFAHRSCPKERPPLSLLQCEIQPINNTKYLGVIFDQNLNWKAQHANALGKGTNWASQIKHLTRPTWGITPKYARKLYISVALPRILYVVDIWGAPTGKRELSGKASLKILWQIMSIQRIGALTITGSLKTSPTDALNACANLLPALLVVIKRQHGALVCMATLPECHPLASTVRRKTVRKPESTRHP
jgi:hypothetical protein